MLTIDIPGQPRLQLEHLVLDFNGTLAVDGALLDGVASLLERVAKTLQIHVVTGNTFGGVRESLDGLPCDVVVLDTLDQTQAKGDYVQRLGPDAVACVGNGRNDRRMMQAAALAIAVIQGEGAAPATLFLADVVARDVRDALQLLLNPLRLAATLRS